ncbi:FtsX-like permease family protein [Microbacterium invictum]|uniref:ABC transport system permease protein n=1 Tax=Microbacterium invictum TaxID=515415 RepID=A0AA40VNQ7_9MICO|nr:MULTISPECIES: FtsX-like permease family protein [Microbacterium]MBB4141107.1 putative ABC transport system permease protein [Microbacterium invictum]
MTTARLMLPHLRAGLGSILTVAAIVLTLTAGAVFAPIAVTGMLDASTRHRVEALSPAVRDLGASGPFTPWPGSGPQPTASLPEEYRATWGLWDSSIRTIRDEMPGDLADVFGEAEYYTRYGEPGEFNGTTYVALDPRFAERIDVGDGRLPELTVTEPQWEELFADAWDDTGQPAEGFEPALPAIEIVLSAASAREVDWAIGETRTVGTEATWQFPLPLVLVGTFDAVDADDPYWTRGTGVLAPSIGFDPDGVPYVRTTGYVPPDMLPMLRWLAPITQTDVWYPAEVEKFTADGAPELLAALRGFTSRAQPLTLPDGFTYASLTFQSGTVDALEDAVAGNASLVAVIGMLLSGPVGVALAVLLLGCRLLWERRRAGAALLSARGASDRQLRALLALDGLVAGVIPAVIGAGIGLAVAALIVPGQSASPAMLVLPVVLALLPGASGVVVAAQHRGRGRADTRRSSVWRLIIDIGIVLLAALATALLVLRGTAATSEQLDPLAVAAPFLLSLAACVLTLRLYPAVLRVVLARQQRRPGFTGLVGAARALRDPATGTAPVLALIVGVSFAVAGGILLSIVQNGAEHAARAAVGADLQVQALRLTDEDIAAVTAVDGVAAVAPVSVLPASELEVDQRRARVNLYLADPQLLGDAQRGYPASIPDDVDLRSVDGVPRLLFAQTVADRERVEADSAIEIIGAPAQAAGAAPGTAAFAISSNWVLTDIASLEQITDRVPTATHLFIRIDADSSVDAVVAGIRDILGHTVTVTTAADALAQIDSDPAVTGLRAVLLAGIAISALLSAVAVVVTLVLGSRARQRILALLQTLGAPPRTGSRLLAWELVPAGLAALVVGGVFGALLPLLLSAVIDLRSFTTGDVAPAYRVDPLILLLTVGGFIAVTAGATLAALAIARRARAAAILRTVEDT